jgi:hypothetical protein
MNVNLPIPLQWQPYVGVSALFAWLISHQPAVLFSQNKPASSNQPAVLFSQNKPAPSISHQPTEQAAHIQTSKKLNMLRRRKDKGGYIQLLIGGHQGDHVLVERLRLRHGKESDVGRDNWLLVGLNL